MTVATIAPSSESAASTSTKVRRIAIMGAGGLGRSAASLLAHKSEFRLVALADREGIAHDARRRTPARSGRPCARTRRRAAAVGRQR